MGLSRRRITVAIGTAALAVGVAALAFVAVGLAAGTPSHHDAATTVPAAPAVAAVTAPAASTLVARTDGSIPGDASPEATAPSMTVPGTWYGYPSIPPGTPIDVIG
jgi:hypothetical protein